ncbi:hypothetical protein GIB67_040798 [Kingdonia uniflora]|uniref:Pectinesterase n=1 Tax=Kingdonia uniflora TaxID=39325 RepID=A0A7J7P4D8_9MAGN|nr:hypothetical protein GIB67_040798 [Kingdonia uniflora]
MAGKMNIPVILLTTTLFVLLFPLVPATIDKELQAAEMDMKLIKVRKDGTGDFLTVTDAIKSIPAGNTIRTIIWIGPGIYKEKILVDRFKHFVTFYGSKPVYPTLTFGDNAKKLGTFNSATVIVESNYFQAVNIVFQNSSPEPDGKELNGGQAVALRISGDKASFYNCKFIGFQDTLCDDKGNHFFTNCYIEGTVDFIFGNGKSLYLNTVINSIAKGLSAITAQARSTADEKSGFSFVHCNITGTGNTYLGRAWKQRAKVVFAYTYMGTAVHPEGWNNKGYKDRDKTLSYGEYKNYGPGAATKDRVTYSRTLTDEQAKPYLDQSYVGGASWLLPPPRLNDLKKIKSLKLGAKPSPKPLGSNPIPKSSPQ